MTRRYAHKNVRDVADAAARFGLAETQESRFPSSDLGAEQTGFAHHVFKAGKRQPFGHRHGEAEEIYFVVSGSGRINLDGDVVELRERDVVRVSPSVTRAFEAGDDGLEGLAFGPRREDDRGELIDGWWQS